MTRIRLATLLGFLINIGYVGISRTQVTTGLSISSLTTSAALLQREVGGSKPLSQRVAEAEDLACGKRHFCNASLGIYDNNPCFSCLFKCKCDTDCQLFGDCCVDVAFKDSNFSFSESKLKCLDRFPKINREKDPEYIFMIALCRRRTVDEDTMLKCEQPNVSDYQQATPVTDLSTNLTYRNIFCAQCFGVERYQIWTYDIECQVGSLAEKATTKDELWEFALDDRKCIVISSPPVSSAQSLRPCVPKTVDKCNVTGKWETYDKETEELCSSYYHPLKNTLKGILFRNVYCAICNGVNISREVNCPLTGDGDMPTTIRGILDSRPLSVLIDFNADVKASDNVRDVSALPAWGCEMNEIYDPVTDTCKPIECSRRRIWTDGDCKPLYRSCHGLGYIFSLTIQPSRAVEGNSFYSIMNSFERGIQTALQPFKPFTLTLIQYDGFAVLRGNETDFSNRELAGLGVTSNMVSAANATIVAMEEALRSLENMIINVPEIGGNVSFKTRFVSCPGSKRDTVLGEPVAQWSIGQLAFPNGCFSDACITGIEFLPVYDILNCPHLTINMTESNASYNEDNATLTVLNMTIVLNESNHYFCGTALKVCVSVLYDIQAMTQSPEGPYNNVFQVPDVVGDLPMTIVSLICIILSLAGLLLTFIIYSILTPLRTLPGKNTMGLIFHLFCAQLLFQVGIELDFNVTLCRAMGVLIHYLWLTAFFWMSICAYHMASVFSNITVTRWKVKTAERKTLVRYAIIANVFGLIFTVTCVSYNLGISQGSEMGYGGDICFLNKPMDIGIFFALPLGLVLLFNICCFTKTILSIRNVPDMEDYKNNRNRNHTHVYFRLSILLGFTWVFGFVATIFNTDILWYIFIILNGLQGVFIFCAYCVNRRTCQLLKSRFKRQAKVKNSTESQSSTSDRNAESSDL